MKSNGLAAGLSRLWRVILPISIALAGSACRKSPDSTLGDELGRQDFLTERYQDTAFDIEVFSRPDTGLIIQNASRILLGSAQDAVFGRADYHLYTQLRYAGTNVEEWGFVPGEDRIDSVVLILPYSALYPQENSEAATRPIRLRVHALTEELLDSDNADSVYSISSEVAYDPTPFGGIVELQPRPFDSIHDTVNNTTYVPSLRVPLDASLGQKLLSLPAGAYDSMEAFTRYFPGLCLRSVSALSESESAVVSFAFGSTSVTDEVAHIIVYHGLVAPDTARSTIFTFGPVLFSKVVYDYSTSTDADFRAQMMEGDSTAGARAVYLMASGGAYLSCRLPNVRELFAGRHVIINRAYLVLPAAATANASGLTLPKTLTIPGSLDEAYVPGGTWESGHARYRLVLTRYLQRLFYEEAEPQPFHIYPSTTERYGTPCAVKLNGPEATASPMKLELIYTEVADD